MQCINALRQEVVEAYKRLPGQGLLLVTSGAIISACGFAPVGATIDTIFIDPEMRVVLGHIKFVRLSILRHELQGANTL
jgi:hypothetical protein